MRKTKSRNVLAAVILLALTLVSGCDSHRLDQFADFASAGSQYVQNFHQITAQAGSAMIAIDSATLIVIRNIAVDNGKTMQNLTVHRDKFTKDIQQHDSQVQDYVASLQLIDAHGRLLGSYFAAITQLANGREAAAAATSANSLLDSIDKLNPKIAATTLHVGNFSASVQSFVGPATNLLVAHFEVKALNQNLQKNAVTIDRALSLQEAAVDAISAQMRAALQDSLTVREQTDVIDPWLASTPDLPPEWSAKRAAYLRAKVAIESANSAKKAIVELHKDFRLLVENKNPSIDFASLLSDINKMSGYVSALESTANSSKSANQ